MRRALFLVFASIVFSATLAVASPYDPERNWRGHVPTLMRGIYLSPGAAAEAANVDRDFAANMRKHHEGAVVMANRYLSDNSPGHPLLRKLAHAIITNQEFEIGVLNDVENHVRKGANVSNGIITRQMGWDGLEHTWRFVKAPPPGFFDLWFDATPMAVNDVRFAKEMIIHHQAAVKMAREYNGDPRADNTILKGMNRQIVIDQAYEIKLLKDLIERYPGDSSAITVDPAMIPGMGGGMGHGRH